MTREDEIAAVKLVGEKIGYGNLMSIASALWRRDLRQMGIPESGAFYPICPPYIDKEDFKALRCQDQMTRDDLELDDIYGPAKGNV